MVKNSFCSSNSKESACNAGDPVSIPGSGRSPGGGRGNILQYSCLENPTERLLLNHEKRPDSWPLEEKNLIRGQR